MDYTTETPLAELAVRLPAATRVFHRHGLDFCCGGRRSLAAGSLAAGLEPDAVLAEIEAEARADGEFVRWDERPLPELIDHILERYHAPLREELPRLLAMAEKVEAVHGDKPACPRGLAEHLAQVLEEVEQHLLKEERILFPAIVAGQPVHMPVHVMTQEHDEHAANLRKTRALAHDLEPPPGACTTWRALYLGLAELERELMDHIHLENNVLFPRATRGEAAAV